MGDVEKLTSRFLDVSFSLHRLAQMRAQTILEIRRGKIIKQPLIHRLHCPPILIICSIVYEEIAGRPRCNIRD